MRLVRDPSDASPRSQLATSSFPSAFVFFCESGEQRLERFLEARQIRRRAACRSRRCIEMPFGSRAAIVLRRLVEARVDCPLDDAVIAERLDRRRRHRVHRVGPMSSSTYITSRYAGFFVLVLAHSGRWSVRALGRERLPARRSTFPSGTARYASLAFAIAALPLQRDRASRCLSGAAFDRGIESLVDLPCRRGSRRSSRPSESA